MYGRHVGYKMFKKYIFEIDDKDYTIIVKPQEGYSNYGRLIEALLDKITYAQLDEYTCENKKGKKIIMLPSLLYCFVYYSICESDTTCICGIDISETYQIQNKDDKRLYNIGSVCIKNWIGTEEYLKKSVDDWKRRQTEEPQEKYCCFRFKKTTKKGV